MSSSPGRSIPRNRPDAVDRVSSSWYRITDDSWTIFGALMVVMLGSGAAYCAWRAIPTRVEMPAGEVEVASVSPSTPAFPGAPAANDPPPDWQRFRSSSVVTHPLSWQDLTLMLRTGLRDDEIIAAAAGTQLVSVIGPAQVATLRELGAGDKLINFLRTRAVYALPPTAPQTTAASAPARPRAMAAASTVSNVPSAPTSTPALFDYAAKDRQIKALQTQIDAIDAQILYVRNHPDSIPILGTYNGRGYLQGDESPLKKYLDQLDNRRNDLRREKWRLEGR